MSELESSRTNLSSTPQPRPPSIIIYISVKYSNNIVNTFNKKMNFASTLPRLHLWNMVPWRTHTCMRLSRVHHIRHHCDSGEDCSHFRIHNEQKELCSLKIFYYYFILKTFMWITVLLVRNNKLQCEVTIIPRPGLLAQASWCKKRLFYPSIPFLYKNVYIFFPIYLFIEEKILWCIDILVKCFIYY